ncbi:hypothetical protein RRG08_027477 [Elysia crispata]|uniref:Uncharacterized protein n=1 Tax=Elysia crispata TaxID=231223 RepID=A0AAE0YSC7_9GAST|nr:hypothetical protein RRG08_027477 [Elysia crispata]
MSAFSCWAWALLVGGPSPCQRFHAGHGRFWSADPHHVSVFMLGMGTSQWRVLTLSLFSCLAWVFLWLHSLNKND